MTSPTTTQNTVTHPLDSFDGAMLGGAPLSSENTSCGSRPEIANSESALAPLATAADGAAPEPLDAAVIARTDAASRGRSVGAICTHCTKTLAQAWGSPA
jgi:hypothetical protein